MKNIILSLFAIFLFLTTFIGSGCGPSGGGSIDSGGGMVGLKADYSADIDNLNVAENSWGNAVAVWRVWDGAGFNIYGQYYSADSETWGDTKIITSAEGKTGYPQAIVDDFGNALVVWQQNDESEDNIYANHYDNTAGGWGEPVLIETDAGSASHPSLALDESGNIVVAWQLEVDDTYTVYATVYDTSAGRWGAGGALSSGGNISNLQVALDSDGSVVTTWNQWEGTSNKTFGTNYDLTTYTWSAPTIGSGQ